MHKNVFLIFNEFFGKDLGGQTDTLISKSLTVLKKMLERIIEKTGTFIV